MSFIRGGSNPERLYISGSREGIEISQAWAKRPETNGYIAVVPTEDWHSLCEQYVEYMHDDDEGVEVNGLYVRGEWIDDEEGRNYKTVLGYKDQWRVPMWDVTWEYIVSRYKKRDNG